MIAMTEKYKTYRITLFGNPTRAAYRRSANNLHALGFHENVSEQSYWNSPSHQSLLLVISMSFVACREAARHVVAVVSSLRVLLDPDAHSTERPSVSAREPVGLDGLLRQECFCGILARRVPVDLKRSRRS